MLGDSARGIVHVHGGLGRDPATLVVTDADFGQAYLTKGHTRRFLVSLFIGNCVLFVGYSHNDPILSYLARGLPPATERFALTRPKDAGHWRALAVTPVVIPARRGYRRERLLADSLGGWARYTAMGLDDHRSLVRRMVAEGPPSPLDQEKADYLRATIAHPIRVAFFAEADGEAWLRWASEESTFRDAIVGGQPGSDPVARAELAGWFASKYASANGRLARQVVAGLGGRLSPVAWDRVTRALWQTRPSGADLAAWLPHLVRSWPTDDSLWPTYILLGSRQVEDDGAAVTLFDALTEPLPATDRPGLVLPPDGDGEPRIEFRVRGDDHSLAECYTRVFRDRPEAFAGDLARIATHHLESAGRLLRLGGQADDSLDLLSFRRPSIEAHPQNRHGHAWVDVLVDAARDAIEWLLLHERSRADAYIALWAPSRSPLLRRLAIHAVGADPGRGADRRLEWLLEHDLLLSTAERHEVFRVTAGSYPHASARTRRTTLDAIEKGALPPHIAADAGLSTRVRYDHLQWLLDHRPTDRRLTSLIAVLHRSDPTLVPREHPDFLSWSQTGRVEPAPSPYTPEQLVTIDPGDADLLDRLMAVEQHHDRVDLMWSRTDTLAAVTEAAVARPAWGFGMARALTDRNDASTDLWDALFRAWSRGGLTVEQWHQAIAIGEEHVPGGERAHEIASFLYEAVASKPARLPVALLGDAYGLARRLWDSLPADGPAEPMGGSWLDRAINEPAGKIAEFVLHALSAARAAGVDVDRLTGWRTWLGSMLGGDSRPDGMGRAIIASQLRFLFGLDRTWCLADVLPVFDWSRPLHAEQAWHGFLTWGRLDPELAQTLLASFLAAIAHMDSLGSLRDRFWEFMAALPFLVPHQPGNGWWLLRFLQVAAADEVDTWSRAVDWQLSSLDGTGRDAAWVGWMHRYVQLRMEGRPRPATSAEVREMTNWVLRLGVSFVQGAELLRVGAPGGLDPSILHGLSDSAASRDHPSELADLVAHALAGQGPGFWGCPPLTELLVNLQERLPAEALRPLREQLLRLGCQP